MATISGKDLKKQISILSRIFSLGATSMWGEGMENSEGGALSTRSQHKAKDVGGEDKPQECNI